MKLSDVLKALAANNGMTISIVNADDENLISFNAAGYESVESDLQEHEVKKIQITSAKEVKIIIGDIAP